MVLCVARGLDQVILAHLHGKERIEHALSQPSNASCIRGQPGSQAGGQAAGQPDRQAAGQPGSRLLNVPGSH